MNAIAELPRVDDELDVLDALVDLRQQRIVEVGCGAANLARALLARRPGCRVTGLEVDTIQHARNLERPQAGLEFVAAGAQSIPFPDAAFDLALMLKSLHHVPVPDMADGLEEIARVLVPGGLLYVSEPVYDGPLNEVIRLFNDEGVVRAAAQRALDAAVASGRWTQVYERMFAVPVRSASFDEFERRMMRPSFADHRLDDAKIAAVRAAFVPHLGPDGARFERPMHVRLLRRKGDSQ